MRYEVKVVMNLEHSLAVEAEDPLEAQTLAIAQVSSRPAERSEMHIEVERGSR